MITETEKAKENAKLFKKAVGEIKIARNSAFCLQHWEDCEDALQHLYEFPEHYKEEIGDYEKACKIYEKIKRRNLENDK